MRGYDLPALAIGLLGAGAVTLSGQAFRSLATTEDGSVLYFSSSVRQRGTDQSYHSKIFRWDAENGFRIVAEQRDKGECDPCQCSNFFQLAGPSVSADGSTLAYTARRPVGGSKFCSPAEPSQGVVRVGSRELRLDGVTAVSRNGRYAVSAPAAALASRWHLVTDVSSGVSSALAGPFIGASQTITDEGSIISAETRALVVWQRNGLTQLFQTQQEAQGVIIDRAGRTAVYYATVGPTSGGAITTVDLLTGRETKLRGAFGPGYVNITSDGSTVFFFDSSQLYVSSVNAGTVRQLTKEPAGARFGVVSGDGRIAYVVTGDSRLLRIDIPTGQATEIAAVPPEITSLWRLYRRVQGTVAVGDPLELWGSSISRISSVDVCGREVPARRLPDPIALRFEVPWDLPDGLCQVVVHDDLFEHAVDVNIKQYEPQFGPVLIHGDFRGWVTASDPARPGELVVAYMIGLGPVDDSGRLRRAGFRCSIGLAEAAVEYVGLTSQYPGIFQVNVRVPEALVPSVFPQQQQMTCGWDVDTQAGISIILGR